MELTINLMTVAKAFGGFAASFYIAMLFLWPINEKEAGPGRWFFLAVALVAFWTWLFNVWHFNFTV